MKIDIISVVPDLLESPFAHSIMKRAREKGLLEVNCINLRDHTTYARAQVDDYAFGGGAGMVMMIEPLVNAIESLRGDRRREGRIRKSPRPRQPEAQFGSPANNPRRSGVADRKSVV